MLALAIMAGLGVRYVGSGHQAAMNAGITRVAVFPFSVPPDAEYADLDVGLMELLGASLDGAGELRKVDPYAVLNQLRRSESRREIDVEIARGIGRELGASHFVLGRLLDLRGTVRISASLYSLASDSTLQSDHAGELEELQGLVDAVARDILVYMEPVVGEFNGSVSTASTHSYAALLAYLRGRALMRRHEVDSAWVQFKSAVEEDSMFALAWLGLAEAGHWKPLSVSATENLAHWERAHHLRVRLNDRNRAFLAVGLAFARWEPAATERAARAMVTAYPDAPEGWRYLGESLTYHFAWQRGRNSASEAEQALQRALALDPDNRLALNELAIVAYHEGHKARGDSLYKLGNGVYWVPPEDSLGRAQYFARLASAEPWPLRNKAMAISLFTDSLHDAARVAMLLTDPTWPDSTLALGHHVAAWVSLARGEWQSARVHFGAANRLEPGLGVLEWAWYTAFPFFGIDSTTIRAARDSLAAWTPPTSFVVEDAAYWRDARPARWLLPHAKYYILGLLSARLGETDAAALYAAQLEGASEPADSIALLRDLALEVRALSAAERGEWEAALLLLADAELRGSWQFLAAFERRALGRFLRAEALMHLGRNLESLGWYSTLGWVYNEYVFVAPVQLREGEIYEQLGDLAEAVRHYRRFVTRWRDADPQYQPLVADVRSRIARLASDRLIEGN